MRCFFGALLACGVFAHPVAAGCATDGQIDRFVADYLSATPTSALSPDGTMKDALCTQARIVSALEPHLGPVIGYKAGLTSAPAQERFGSPEPVQGVLFRDMMLDDGATVPSD